MLRKNMNGGCNIEIIEKMVKNGEIKALEK